MVSVTTTVTFRYIMAMVTVRVSNKIQNMVGLANLPLSLLLQSLTYLKCQISKKQKHEAQRALYHSVQILLIKLT